ncbi:hypothetical protein J6Y50_05090 [bacterium]|jgi:hypothetical protein|nr:hypothetical protein [bacterium]
MKRVFVIFLVVISVAAVVYAAVSMKKMSAKDAEIASLKAEKIALLSEHEECLTYKEQSLKKELLTKYLDSIVILLNRIDAGHMPTKDEIDNFYDRTDFIIKNIGSAAVSKEETNLVLTFIDSAKKTFETKIQASPEKDKK